MEEDTTYGLTAEALGRLLAIGMREVRGRKNDASGRPADEVLESMLSNHLSVDAAEPDSLPALLNRSCHELLPMKDRALSQLLLDPTTGLVVIKTLKHYAKELVLRPGVEARRAAATVIYHAAIASALVSHQQKITQHSYAQLREAWAHLGRETWIPSPLKELSQNAESVCRRKEKETE